jgi:hypothetical protein
MSVLTQQPATDTAPGYQDEAPSGSGNRRTLLLVGGLVAALVAAAAAWFFLFSGSGSTPSPLAVQPKAAAPKTAPSAGPSASASTPATSGYQVTKRDPFAPLPSAGAGSSTTSTSTSTSKGSTAGAPTPAAPIAAPLTLILASVDAKASTATLSIDGTSYSAAVGKVFGKNYMLYAVFNASCAGVLVGDQSVPLCVGHSVSVTP